MSGQQQPLSPSPPSSPVTSPPIFNKRYTIKLNTVTLTKTATEVETIRNLFINTVQIIIDYINKIQKQEKSSQAEGYFGESTDDGYDEYYKKITGSRRSYYYQIGSNFNNLEKNIDYIYDLCSYSDDSIVKNNILVIKNIIIILDTNPLKLLHDNIIKQGQALEIKLNGLQGNQANPEINKIQLLRGYYLKIIPKLKYIIDKIQQYKTDQELKEEEETKEFLSRQRNVLKDILWNSALYLSKITYGITDTNALDTVHTSEFRQNIRESFLIFCKDTGDGWQTSDTLGKPKKFGLDFDARLVSFFIDWANKMNYLKDSSSGNLNAADCGNVYVSNSIHDYVKNIYITGSGSLPPLDYKCFYTSIVDPQTECSSMDDFEMKIHLSNKFPDNQGIDLSIQLIDDDGNDIQGGIEYNVISSTGDNTEISVNTNIISDMNIKDSSGNKLKIETSVPILQKTNFIKGISTLSVGVMTKKIIENFEKWKQTTNANQDTLSHEILNLCLQKTMGDFGQELEALKYGYIYLANDRPSGIRYMFLKSIFTDRPGWGGYITTHLDSKTNIRKNKFIYIDSDNNIYQQEGENDDGILPKAGILKSNNTRNDAKGGMGYEMKISKQNYKLLILLLIHDIFHDFYDFSDKARSFNTENLTYMSDPGERIGVDTNLAHLQRTYSTQRQGGGSVKYTYKGGKNNELLLNEYDTEISKYMKTPEYYKEFMTLVNEWMEYYDINSLSIINTDDIDERDSRIYSLIDDFISQGLIDENLMHKILIAISSDRITRSALSLDIESNRVNLKYFILACIYQSNKKNFQIDNISIDKEAIDITNNILSDLTIIDIYNISGDIDQNKYNFETQSQDKQIVSSFLYNSIIEEEEIIRKINTIRTELNNLQQSQQLSQEQIYGKTRMQQYYIEEYYSQFIKSIATDIFAGGVDNPHNYIESKIIETLNIWSGNTMISYILNPYFMKNLYEAIINKLYTDIKPFERTDIFIIFMFSIYIAFTSKLIEIVYSKGLNPINYINIFDNTITLIIHYLNVYKEVILENNVLKSYIQNSIDTMLNNSDYNNNEYKNLINYIRQNEIRGGKNRNKKKKTKKKNKKKKKAKKKKKKTKKKKNYNIFDYFM